MLANVMLNLDALPMRAAPVLVDAFLKGVFLLLVCSVAVFALRRASAALRHLVWTIGLAGVLLMPVLNAVLPAWRVLMPMPAVTRAVPVSDGINAVIVPASEQDARALTAIVNAAAPKREIAQQDLATLDGLSFKVSTKPEPKLDWRVVAFLIWLGGAFASLGSLLFSVVRVRGIQRGAQPVTSGPCVEAVARAARRIGLRHPPRVHMGDERMMPMVWGLFRPVLLLPAGAARWPAARLEAVLLHELAHVRRRDALTQLIAEIARAIYWFNPLVWLAARQMYLERELACDDMVLNAGTRPSDYAGDLLDLVRSLRASRATGLAAIAMARPSQIKVRLRAVLDDARSRGSLERRAIIGATIVSLGVIAPLAAARPRTAGAKTAIPTLSEAAMEATVPPAAQVRPPAPAAQASIAGGPEISALYQSDQVQETCIDPNARRNGTSISSNSDDDITTVKWVSGRCSGHVRMEGKVRFSGDLKGITSISSGGIFQIDEDDGRVDRRLTIRPSGSQLEYDYRVDGRRAEYDAAAREWFATALLALYRSTGFAADERVDYLLSTQGPQAVVAEVGLMRSDYVQRVYLQKLLERSNLTPGLVLSAVETAAREIDSDYELAQVLIAFAGKYEFNDATRKAFIDATRTIQSDYEQRRVLSTALKKGDLDSQDVTTMLKASSDLSSDYERAQLLMGVSEKYKMDAAMRGAYLDAARGIRSDYEKRRVFENLVSQGAMSPADLASMLEYASGISSDYEKAQVLIGLNKFDLTDAALQRAYLTAASSIRSDYELRRVLTTLVEKDRLTPANLDIALRSAQEIDSDYELAQVLLLVASKHDLSGPQREAFMKALNSISSSYEYGRVASALLKKSN